jgi:hypothetical protein
MTTTSKQTSSLLVTVLMAAGIGLAGVAAAADTTGTSTSTQTGKPMAPAMDTKAAAPSKAEPPASAFRKLDTSGKGYVTKDEAKAVSGFDKAFQDNDANHDGKLSSEEFKKAWAEYSGNKY